MLSSSLYAFYRKYVYPSIRSVRGATRVHNILRDKAALTLENVDMEDMTDFLEEDWQNLIILDACRYDLFEEFIQGYNSKPVYSVGSSSADFVRNTFSEVQLEDVVLVTANPHFHSSRFQELTGSQVEDVFHTVYHLYETQWSDENGTVMPEDVNEVALSANKLFPKKRLLIWYMQPHFPFVNSEIESVPLGTKDKDNAVSIWERAASGEISKDEVWEAYGKNLQYVFEKARKLSNDLEGKTVVTSDHGNLVGEANVFGHPKETHVAPLHEVPWPEL